MNVFGLQMDMQYTRLYFKNVHEGLIKFPKPWCQNPLPYYQKCERSSCHVDKFKMSIAIQN
jgi:hypothetical protein